MREVFVAGTGVVPFATEGKPAAELALDAGLAAMGDASIGFGDVQSVHTGYVAAGATTGVRVAKEFGLTGAPVHHVENASATGLATFRDAWMAVAGGHCDVALALAFDSLSGRSSRKRRGGGGGGRSFVGGRNSLEGAILPAAFFAMWAQRRMHDYGTTIETFAEIAAKNWNHARDCEWAQRRSDHPVTVEEVLASRVIADPHTSMMSCGVSSGAAAAVLVSDEYARSLRDRPTVRVRSAVMQSERYTEGHVFLGPVIGPSQMTADTAAEAYEKAGVGPEDLDLVQVHDAFPIEELVYYELLGICGDGEGDKLVASGETRIGGRIPFSTDGGLIARGHPGGPTGLAQIHETVTQLEGRAGSRQVDGATVGMCHLVGAGSTCVVAILAR
jgi:acetyl-CoA acetyltransferase